MRLRRKQTNHATFVKQKHLISWASLPKAKRKRQRLHCFIVLATTIFILLDSYLRTLFQLDDLFEVKSKLDQNENKDVSLSNFVSGFNDLYQDANRTTPSDCDQDTTTLLLEEWGKNHTQVMCEITSSVSIATREQETRIYNSTSQVLVDEFILPRWEAQPKILRYRNVEIFSMRDPILTECLPSKMIPKNVLEDSKTRTAESGTASFDTIYVDATVIWIRPFDVQNAYEAFHAYVNVALVMIMFEIQDPQLVLVLNNPNERDTDMWRLFSKLEPIFVPQNPTDELPLPGTKYYFREIIEAPNSGLSMINTKSMPGSLLGRGANHECKSPLLLAIIQWIKQRLDSMYRAPDPLSSVDSRDPNRPIQILWSSRQPYCCREGEIWKPKRIIVNETQWIDSLGARLGNDYNVKIVDFATLSLVESIQIVGQSDIIVGVHGAGLIWSLFLPFGESGELKGVVEIFAGDRFPSNRHYHNVASLVGIQYRETEFWSSKATKVFFNEERLDEVVSQIRSIDIKQDRK